MSPKLSSRVGRFASPVNIYTAVLAIAFAVLVATAAFVAYTSYIEYGTFFKIPPN